MNSPQDSAARDRLPQLAAAGPGEVENWLDQLVDGELDDAQRRALLLQLEDQPQGWRRCALAFLEAQAWGSELERVAAGQEDGAEAGGKQAAPAGRPPRWLPPHSVLAMAASFLVAFGLGVVVQNAWRGGGQDAVMPGDGVADGAAAVGPDAAAIAAAEQGDGTAQWGTVRLVVDGQDGVPEQVDLPVVDGLRVDDWLGQQRPGLPSALIEQLERLGHRVQTQRRLYEVPLEDGRRALVPVDDVEVHPGGGVKQYQ